MVPVKNIAFSPSKNRKVANLEMDRSKVPQNSVLLAADDNPTSNLSKKKDRLVTTLLLADPAESGI